MVPATYVEVDDIFLSPLGDGTCQMRHLARSQEDVGVLLEVILPVKFTCTCTDTCTDTGTDTGMDLTG